MDWKEEASAKLKRKNQILFAKNSEFLQDLSMLIEEQSHRTLALWAFDLAEEAVEILEEKYPGEARPAPRLSFQGSGQGERLKCRSQSAQSLIAMPLPRR